MADAKRPILVWVIFLFYLVVCVTEIVALFATSAGLFDLPPENMAAIASMTVIDRIMGYLIASLVIIGVFLLMRLKKLAVSVMVLALVLEVVSRIVTHVTHDLGSVTAPEAVAGQFAGPALFACACLYAWSLKNKGILK